MNTAMIIKLDQGQKRRQKPTVVNQLTLLDIIANGTAIHLFKETVVDLQGDVRSRYVLKVRRQHGRDWSSKQVMWPTDQLSRAILEVNKVAQQEIQRATILATA